MMLHTEYTKAKLIDTATAIVAEVTSVDVQQMCSSLRNAEAVDARYIVVHLLSLQGFYAGDIAKVLCRSKRTVEKMKAEWAVRMRDPSRKMLQRLAIAAEKQMRSKCEVDAK